MEPLHRTILMITYRDMYFQQFLNKRSTVSELIEHIRVGTKWYKFSVLLKLDTNKLNAIDELKKLLMLKS